MQSKQLIQVNSRYGSKTSFWKDSWCTILPLKEKYPLLWRLSKVKEATVSDVITWAHSNSAWNLHFNRNLRRLEVQEAINLVEDIGNPELITVQEDVRTWLPSQSGKFSTKSCYDVQLVDNDAYSFPDPKLIWNATVPPKVSFLIWSTVWNATPTFDNLVRRGVRVRSLQCVLCRAKDETIHHVLLHCTVSYKVWSYFLEYCKVDLAMCETTEGCIKSWKRKISNAIHNFIWYNLPYAIRWALWIERNRRVFHNKDLAPNDVIVAVKSLIFQRGLPYQVFEGLYFDDLIHNWETKIYM